MARPFSIGVIAIALIVGILTESRWWDNDIVLFERAVEKAPSSIVPRIALAGAYLDDGQQELARQSIQETLARFPDDLRA